MYPRRVLSGSLLRVPPMLRYGVGVGVALLAILLRLALDPVWDARLPYITLFPAIMLSGWLGGLRAGIVTTALCATGAYYLWIEPGRSPGVTEWSDLLGLLVFVIVGVLISVLNEAWLRGTAALAESRERLSVTLSSIGEAVITTDEEGQVTGLNPVAEQLMGWSTADAVGKPLDDILTIVNEHSREPAESPVGRVLREGGISGLANHTLLVTRDGREIPIDDSAAPIRTKEGRLVGVVMVFRDITERRRIERAHDELLERERITRREVESKAQQLQTALHAGHLGTWQYTMATGEVRWSPELEAIHGLSRGSFPGTFEAFRDEIHPDDRERVAQAIGAAAETRRDHHVEYRIIRADGGVRWVEGLGEVLYDEDGRPDRMVGVCADITERKLIEEERTLIILREQTARAEIERAARLKDDFLAALSHELRTPLNAILGYATLLSTGVVANERAAQALESIERNAQAQARLVDSLLDLSRIMAGKLELDLESLELAGIVDAAVGVVRRDAETKGVVIEIVGPTSPSIIVADGGRLQQVFWNLLANAIKFTPPGGRIDVRWKEENSEVRVEVTDTGQGISPDFLPYIFDRFSQADGAKGRARSGLGLGLALVREMVQAHGGTVTAESAGEGRGSTLTVALPLTPIKLWKPPESQLLNSPRI